jgi:hypothetical protein
MIAHGDDGADLTSTTRAGGRKRNQLGTWYTGEVKEVDPGKDFAVGAPHRSPHGMNAVLAKIRVGVGVDRRSSSLSSCRSSAVRSRADSGRLMA